MKITKLFLNTAAQLRWLNSMSQNGYELTRRTLFCYHFEKSNTPTFYQYVFLKQGKKSFLELDYKAKDKNARLVFGNSELALFKCKGREPQILSDKDLRLNHLMYIQKKRMSAVMSLALAMCASLIARQQPVLWVVTLALIIASISYSLSANAIKKMM